MLSGMRSGGLTDEQRQAVARRDGSLLLSAGAGAGKTSVLVERFVCAVLEDGLPPARILAITFTERAAGELRERVRSRFIELGEREAARDLESAFLSTFHGFCMRVLRVHALAAGLDPDFAVLEESLAERLRGIAFAAALRDYLAERGAPAVDLLGAYGADRVRSMIFAVYEELRSRGELEPRLPAARIEGSAEQAAEALRAAMALAGSELDVASRERDGVRVRQGITALERAGVLLERDPSSTPPSPRELGELKLAGATGVLAGPGCEAYRQALADYIRVCVDLRGAGVCGLLDGLLERFSGAYAELKRARWALDFDDLELQTRALLERQAQIRASWSERFELLMVDEFQDCNPRQLEILAALERANLCTVGDEFQSIYGFRHADVSLFRERRAQLERRGAIVTLARNFRGRPPMLEAINAVFTPRFGDDYTRLLPARGASEDGEPLVELLLCDKRECTGEGEPCPPPITADAGYSATVAPWRLAEARMLAARIAQLLSGGDTEPGDVVLLLRALGDVAVYERALAEQGITTIAAVGGFWGHQQVGDLLSYLRTLANPLDELSLLSTLACPLVGVSSDGLALLVGHAREEARGVWETIREHLDAPVSARERESLERFCGYLCAERASAPGRPIAELIERVVRFSGYEDHVLGLPWGQRRLANVHKLMRLAHTFESSEGRDLRGFLDHVAQLELTAGSSEPDAPVADSDESAVRLMSIHAAKGLEFGVVCIPDLGRAPNLRAPDLLVDRRGADTDTDARVGLKLLCLDGSESADALDFELLRDERRLAEAEEEDRILYVAMTRARERLLLSAAADFENWPADTLTAPSIGWLAPALVEDLPDLLNGGEGTSVARVPGTDAYVRCWVGATIRATTAQREHQIAEPSPPREPRAGPDSGAGALAAEQLSLPGMHDTPPVLPPALHHRRTLSYSSLTKFERCGYRYYLEEVLGLPETRPPRGGPDMSEGLAGRSRGQIVHRLLEAVDFRAPRPVSLGEVRAAGRELGVRITPAQGERMAALVERLARSGLARRLADAPVLSREQPFAFVLAPLRELATGVLDLSAREPDGGWLVIDYKSDRVTHNEDLQALVCRQYATQRMLYALAALHSGARVVEVVHWFLERPEDWVSATYGADQRPQLERELLERATALQSGAFTVSPTPHRELCLTCPGRRGLCSWDQLSTSRATR
jgi:ATP-dependent exoDNAse (exonuclease V) beta subunit